MVINVLNNVCPCSGPAAQRAISDLVPVWEALDSDFLLLESMICSNPAGLEQDRATGI
jgi:hypothetical protein